MPAAPTAPAVVSPSLSATPLRAARLVAGALMRVALGIAVGVCGAILVPSLFGHKAMTVISGSMEPTLGVGSMVLDEVIAPLDARPGDIVTFKDPTRGGQVVTHRLRSARAEGSTAFMVTKGDANNAVERWSVPTDGKIGRVAYHVPKLGYVRSFLTGPRARIALLGIMMCLGCWVLLDVWRRP